MHYSDYALFKAESGDMSTSLVSSQVLWTDEAFASAKGEWQGKVLQSPDSQHNIEKQRSSLYCYSPASR